MRFNLVVLEESKATRETGNKACQSQWPSRLVSVNSSQPMLAEVLNQLISFNVLAGVRL